MNQREIKFRAWNGERMKEVLTWGFNEKFISTPKEISPEDDFKVMQYTGLKDKNGKEIFEGDLATDAHNEHYEVVFSDASFAVVHDGNVIEPLNEVASGIEIIGNIYENDDLLSSLDTNPK